MSRYAMYLATCPTCGGKTSKKYLREHGSCKPCRTPGGAPEAPADSTTTARIIDQGWQGYALEEGHYDCGGDR